MIPIVLEEELDGANVLSVNSPLVLVVTDATPEAVTGIVSVIEDAVDTGAELCSPATD